jgi:hypothetical protein
MQSNLGSRTPRIMNSSVYELIFRTQSVSDDVLCFKLRTLKPSTSWSDKLGVSASAVFVEEWSSGKYPESVIPIGESVSCCLYLICLVLCLSFFCDRFNGFLWFCVKNLCTKYCCKSLSTQSSGVHERINPFYINSYGENIFDLRTTFRNELSSWTEV